MNARESTPSPQKVPDTQPTASGGPPQPPPKPPELTARGLLDPGEPGRRVFVQDYVVVKDLAQLFGLRPFKVVADVMELGVFKHADEAIDFPTAALVARKHGYVAERVV